MSNNKQSSVEWLIAELGEYFPQGIGGIELIVAKAKAMHKEENLQTWLHCLTENDPITFEDYYSSTFGGEDEQQ